MRPEKKKFKLPWLLAMQPDTIQKAQSIKKVIGHYKNLKIYSVKDIVKKLKRQTTDWKKICARHISEKKKILN